MPGEGTGLGKALFAAFDGADKRALPCVDALVDGEVTGLGKALFAAFDGADKRALPCVSALVGGEVTGLGKALFAAFDGADKRALPCVMRLCLVRAPDSVKPCLSTGQTKGRSPVECAGAW